MAATATSTNKPSQAAKAPVNTSESTHLDTGSTVVPSDSTEKIELTDREKAIARGDDPDAVAPVATQPERQDAVAEADTTTQPQTQPTSQASSQPWINDDVKIVAGSLGLSDDELKEFSSADEFLRFSRLMDRRIAGLAKAPQQPEPGQGQVNQPQPGQPQAGQSQPSQSPQPAPSQGASSTLNTGPAASATKPLTPVDPEWYRANGYDEQTVALAQATRDTQDLLNSLLPLRDKVTEQEKLIAQHQQEATERARREEIISFHQAADQLEAQLFGRQFDANGEILQLDKALDDNRRMLWDAYKTLEAGLVERAVRAGHPPVLPPPKSLITRAQQMVFGQQLEAMRAQERIAAAKQQSSTRRPVATGSVSAGLAAAGAATGNRTQDREEDSIKQIANDPRIVEFWNRTQQENGAR